ncbi:MAG: aspartate dehydrogenase domain-containing protein [Myxococcota bacterium]|nr:aspartate dehydrogenase domain-containing protein [Myxococcota bacterium]
MKRRVGIIGYGKLGKFLSHAIQNTELRDEYELSFVWNRNPNRIGAEIPEEKKMAKISDFEKFPSDLIVEVAHPVISQRWGEAFLKHCDYMVGSPTAFAKQETENTLRSAASKNGLYIPRGALPGLEEVLAMKNSGKLETVAITMKKHPGSLKFSGPLDFDLQTLKGRKTVYHGPLRPLCAYAPNNVNTMAVLAMASERGFDHVTATLIADTHLEHHITEVALFGPVQNGQRYSLELIRKSPAGAGAVTSSATFYSFLRSMKQSRKAGAGVHFR